MNYSNNQEVAQQIAETISNAFILVEKIHIAHNDLLHAKKSSYEDVADVIEEVYATMKILDAWASACSDLGRESFSKDELASLANSILNIEQMVDYGFYVSAAYVISGSAVTLNSLSSTIQTEFTELFDILNLLEDFQ